MTVSIKTKPFGEMKIDERQVIDFPDGLLGFEFVKKFVLLDSQDESSPFKWLQAYDEPDLAFVVIQPTDFLQEYKLLIPASDIHSVGASSNKELLVLAIVTIPSNPSEMTANLQGPVIINPNTRKGKQAISLFEGYTVRHRIMDEINTKD